MRALSQHADFGTAVARIFESCRVALGAEAGYVALLDADGATQRIVHFHAATGECGVETGMDMVPVRGFRERTYRAVTCMWSNDFRETEWDALLPPGHVAIENVLLAPMMLEGQAAGLLGFANKPGGFTDADARFASTFGHIAGVALSNSRTLEALERSEERLRATEQSAADAIIIVNAAGSVVSWNQTAERLFGYSAAEIRGHSVTELMPKRYREPHRLALGHARSASSYTGRIVEVAGVRKGGAEFPLELSVARFEAREGVFFTGIVRDITARRRAEAERTFLLGASKVLSGSLDSDAVLHRIVSVAVPTLADWCVLEVMPDGTGTVRSACAHSTPDIEARFSGHHARSPLSLETGRLFTRLLRSAEPVLVERVTDLDLAQLSGDAAYGDLLRAAGVSSYLAIPLHAGDQAIGALAWFRGARPEPFDERDVALAQEVARRGVTALEHARLHESTERERARLHSLVQERRRLRRHITRLRAEMKASMSGEQTVGQSREFQAVLEQAQMVAQGDTTVLLLGETGTGKELLARMIHGWSKRADAVLVPVNCASIPEALVETELFGHESGALTGATEWRSGKLEAANHGSLFLDEVGDLPLNAQARLLRALQEGQIHVGSSTVTKVDVRVIAATSQDLDAAVREKRFRADLYFRLGVFPIRLPPLRERADDIRPLFEHFVAQVAGRLHRAITGIEQAVFERLIRYPWPGNVRELQNVAERAVILTAGSTIETPSIVLPLEAGTRRPATGTLADADRRLIIDTLAQCHGRVSGKYGAARRLGLKPTTLHAKMRKLGITRHGVIAESRD